MRCLKNLLFPLMFCAAFASAAQAKEEIKVNGSTTVLPILQKLSENFMQEYPEEAVSLSGGGSGNGIKALTEGLADIAMSSRPLKDSEKSRADEKQMGLQKTAIALDALVPVVHPSNPVQELSLEQLKKIYRGEIKNWSELGGRKAPIVLISRDTSSGTYEIWDSLVMQKERVSQRALLAASNGSVVQVVSKNPNAIGYVGFGYITEETKPLRIGGISLNEEVAKAGQWPLARELFLFTNSNPKNGTRKLIEYCLDPQKGQSQVLQIGFIPIVR